MTNALSWKALFVVAMLVTSIGCDDNGDTEEPLEEVANYEAVEGLEGGDDGEADEVEPDDTDTLADDPRRQRADEADQALRQRLMGRVMEVANQEGFDAAVDVCHDEAGPLTDEVSEEFNVAIGRVSDRLRNPDNSGHDWVWSMIEEADGQPHYAANDDFRAVKPIELADGCVNCHGNTDELAEGVPELLEERYPDDEATGYEVGDLRGWVWVEVPES